MRLTLIEVPGLILFNLVHSVCLARELTAGEVPSHVSIRQRLCAKLTKINGRNMNYLTLAWLKWNLHYVINYYANSDELIGSESFIATKTTSQVCAKDAC